MRLTLATVLMTLTSVAYAQNYISNPNFNLWNNTDRTIVGVWLSTENDRQWHAVSGDQIDPQGSDRITFQKPQETPCSGVQMRVKFADGYYANFMDGFNICVINNIVVQFNNNDRGYEALYK